MKRTPHPANEPKKNNMKVARTLMYLIGFGCFLHVMFVGPPQAVSPDESADPDTTKATFGASSSSSSRTVSKKDNYYNNYNQMEQDDPLDSANDDEEAPVITVQATEPIQVQLIRPTTLDANAPCPPQSEEKTEYRKEFEKFFPVQVPYESVQDWDAIPCAHMRRTCDLQNTTWGHPFIMISFGRAGTTSTWDIIAGLTGEYIPKASEDEGKDKGAARAFFAKQNQTEHGKCWLERLLCEKQFINKQAYKAGKGMASMFGTKWKPWHQGLNTTQARQALQWVGAHPNIKVVYNTRNMVDMFISANKHRVLQKLFGSERTAHCHDDLDLDLSDESWAKLEAMGIPRNTPCVQIFKQIESKSPIKVSHMLDYFEKNRLQSDFAVELMDYYNVSRVTVTYEKLYFREDAEEWMRIFRYLGYGPQHNLTLEQAFARTTFQKTSAKNRADRMANYEEVYNALRCTRYFKYLD